MEAMDKEFPDDHKQFYPITDVQSALKRVVSEKEETIDIETENIFEGAETEEFIAAPGISEPQTETTEDIPEQSEETAGIETPDWTEDEDLGRESRK